VIHRHRWWYLADPDPECSGKPVWRLCTRCKAIEKLGFEGWRLYLSRPPRRDVIRGGTLRWRR
jgi:hypothetical protein